MKFGIKHALVVAICALCVCVVATGTVVAVTVGGRSAEAATNFTIRFEMSDGTLAPQWTGVVVAENAPMTGENPITLPSGQRMRVYVTSHGIHQLGGLVLRTDLTLNSRRAGSGTRAIDWDVNWEPTQGGTTWSQYNNNLSWFPPAGLTMTVVVRLTEGPAVRLSSAAESIAIVRRNSTGGAIDTITRSQGLHGVGTGVGTPIPNPATPANFRGWSYRQGGPVIWPVGLPMYVVSDMRIYAIHG